MPKLVKIVAAFLVACFLIYHLGCPIWHWTQGFWKHSAAVVKSDRSKTKKIIDIGDKPFDDATDWVKRVDPGAWLEKNTCDPRHCPRSTPTSTSTTTLQAKKPPATVKLRKMPPGASRSSTVRQPAPSTSQPAPSAPFLL